jgi:DNA-binding NtrC family response regulator
MTMINEQLCGIYLTDSFDQSPKSEGLWSTSDSTDIVAPRPKILIVDDEKRIADNLCKILNLSGFDAVAAYDGWSALQVVAKACPDYLLSDVLMPRMNGVELAIAVHTSCAKAKVLLFSGQAGISEILESAKSRGFTFELIAKPIHPLKLIEQLKAL